MDKYSDQEPLISTEGINPGYVKKTSFFVPIVNRILKIVIWMVFIAWVSLIFLFPLESVGEFLKAFYESGISKTVFGVTGWEFCITGPLFGLLIIIAFLIDLWLVVAGSLFLIFSCPILVVAFLSVVCFIISREDKFQLKKFSKKPNFRLWTFPVLVDGPFGVVSAAEFIGILLFVVYIIWAIYIYTMRNLGLISELTSEEKSYKMLEMSGLRFGMIGSFCMSFLFLPVARGSVLLRLIDIPVEHATRYHVWLGHLTMIIFTLHGLFYVIAWAMRGTFLHEILEWKDIGVANLAGVISLFAGFLMWVTSLPPVRKIYFELFFYTHQLYIVFVIFFALHVGDFLFNIPFGGIFLFLLDRFLRFCQSRRSVDIISATSLPCGTVELVLSKPGNLPYNALSFIFLQIRELSWLQWHPFSVSSSPLDGKYHLSILIKVLGEWTGRLKENILNNSEDEPSKELLLKPNSKITAYVEGPYGHEHPYHLMYENLILVAGGIGISPFLAILSDILLRKREGKPCLPRNIVVVWAVKKSNELSLLSMIDMESICPFFADMLNIDIHIYVTRESEPPLEEGEVHKAIDSSQYPISSGNRISGLVGTGNNIWSGIYLIASTFGFVLLMGLLDFFYINPHGITSWWYKGLLLVACMFASVIIFGGLVILLWHNWETKISAHEQLGEVMKVVDDMQPVTRTDSYQENLASSTIIQYGSRPDFQEIFGAVGERWGYVDVGVIVCGPPGLQTSVARECRSQNISRKYHNPIFHFNSHSFDL